ncbi:GGDEF domain-containing protein [Halomonas sp. BC04]|uniref:GGDEF domain-containing protein n=1 Tax=Halomonas sp. BC04 TaxID=1403540 RepID=UPI0003ED65A8|nr:GGDEF domain-containing protein [Halomonas sp. BC04]EWH03809.1 diguanylate cyclase [Halomonas sp. BC04]
MSFTLLMLLITYQTRWVYPEIHAYFSQAGNLTGQQLATRSREYLQQSLDILLVDPVDEERRHQAHFQLELAYSLFDIGLYRNEYRCTRPSLAALDEMKQLLRSEAGVLPQDLRQGLLDPIRCLTDIEMHQLDRRSSVTASFVEDTRRHQGQVLIGSLVIFLMGLVFWWMHERHRRSAERATRESLAWMARALSDPLTGVGNRSALHQEVLACEGQPLGLILIDIDFFKQYNDCLGHPDGDKLLRHLARLIDETLGGQARLYRMGGDEFAALIDCADDGALAGHCERLVGGLREVALHHPDHPGSAIVTFSVGAARFIAGQAGFDAGYAAADQALYRVKACGRDGWQLAQAQEVSDSCDMKLQGN